MNCQSVEKDFIVYLDGKANPVSRRKIEAHFAECAVCRERAAGFRSVWEALDDLPAVMPSPSFDAAVRARVDRERNRAGFWRSLAPSARLAFAASVLMAFSIWLCSFASFTPARQPAPMVAQGSEAEFKMIEDLPVLENYDVLADFDALSELPAQPAVPAPDRQPEL